MKQFYLILLFLTVGSVNAQVDDMAAYDGPGHETFAFNVGVHVHASSFNGLPGYAFSTGFEKKRQRLIFAVVYGPHQFPIDGKRPFLFMPGFVDYSVVVWKIGPFANFYLFTQLQYKNYETSSYIDTENSGSLLVSYKQYQSFQAFLGPGFNINPFANFSINIQLGPGIERFKWEQTYPYDPGFNIFKEKWNPSLTASFFAQYSFPTKARKKPVLQ